MSFAFDSHVALFGGSFNPPHVGHVAAVKGLFQNPKVGRLVVLPSHSPKLKSTELPFEHRFQMAKLALENTAEISRFEEEEKTEFTWQVLEKLSQKHPKLVFVIGTDQLEQLDRWGRFPEVLSLCDWIVLLRKPATLDTVTPALKKLIAGNILTTTPDPREFKIARNGKTRMLVLVNTDAPDVSSTKIREKLVMGKKEEVQALLPSPVLSYIERNHLYGN